VVAYGDMGKDATAGQDPPTGGSQAGPAQNGAARGGDASVPPSPTVVGMEADDHIFVDNVRKTFGSITEQDEKKWVLRGITMHLKRKQTAVIIGGSGAGKTTLLRMVIGLEKPSTGHIWIDGEDISKLGDVDMNRVRQKFGMVFQYAALLDSLTVYENVAFPLKEHRKHLTPKQMRDKVSSMLKTLGVEGKEDRMPSELSGGQRKRVGLARALMLDPQIIIYDEPTSGLDPITSRLVDDMIEYTRETFGVTSVVISHDMASTFRIAHQAFLLTDGMVRAAGTPDELAQGTAWGDVEYAQAFITKSGVDPQKVSRVEQPDGEGSAVKFRGVD
jgi:phospholipid/cholesterol/gamma-HCH transport system ATP-binding protein